jgi:two-component system, NarL family, invasion response regulator UvrY
MRILIGDDHSMIRKGLTSILHEEFPSAVVEEAKDAEEVIKKTLTDDWDIVICDLTMPGRSGLDVVLHMKQHFPKTPVLILSMLPEEHYAVRALRAGAAGYLRKEGPPEELIKAIRTALLGRRYISPSIADILVNDLELDGSDKPPHESLSHREFTVFQLIASGLSVSAIADQLCLSTTTVSTHRAKVMSKMNMKSNAELTRYALEKKLI